MSDIYLSIVVTTRNDNHGGDLLKRTETFFDGLVAQCNKYKINAELIIVEWNPPADKPLLKEELIPEDNRYLTVRYIIVPPEIHNQYKFKDNIPLFQMIAKNVGIRRALGEFVLCTNIDILFTDELMLSLASKKLKSNTFYRANRCDIPAQVMQFDGIENQLKFARNAIPIRHGKNPKHENITTNLPAWMYYFDSIAITVDYLVKNIKKIIWNKEVQDLNKLDFVACGDFTLMSKQDWVRIEGYVELDLYSLHVDSMALISAKSLGMEQAIFAPNECVYHIHHEDGWSSLENPLGLIHFLIKKPSLDWYTISISGEYLLKEKRNWGLNKPDWGYANETFQEYIYNPSGVLN